MKSENDRPRARKRDRRVDETAPIAFMVMPFGLKDVETEHPAAPGNVDFDALWRNVHAPALKQLGYRPVRADCDLGALIVDEMVQRLAIADLVVADISLPNANVYYEIGVRHAAQRNGCVLVAADWSRPVFDLDQVRRLVYPLPDGACRGDAARRARAVLRRGLPELAQGGSPVFTAVPGYPGKVDRSRLSAFEDLVDALSAFQHGVREIKSTADPDQRRTRTEELVREYGSRYAVRTTVVVELVGLARDHIGPEATVRYIDSLPKALQQHPPVIEQKQIALAKLGDVPRAAAALENLIRHVGPSSDRCGMLGGRYKQLMLASTTSRDRRHYLELAIAAYERGMVEDLNDYYPSSNLPRLYRRRADPGDEERAAEAATVVMAACRRALDRDPDDEWIVLTMLGAAFDRGDAAEADALVTRIERAGAASFHLSTTFADLEASCELSPPAAETRLRPVLARMRSLLTVEGSDQDEAGQHEAEPGQGPRSASTGGCGVRRAEDRAAPRLARIRRMEDVPAVLARLELRRGRPVLVLVGGAGGMGEADVRALDVVLRQAVLPAVTDCGATVVDGGTDSGVMRAIGLARSADGADIALVGVAAEGTVRAPGEGPAAIEDAAELEPNHTHFVLVPGRDWGAESPWIAAVADVIAAESPSVTILVNGGDIAFVDVDRSLERGRPVVVLAGTGRTADAIATAAAGAVADPRAARIAGSRLTTIVPFQDIGAIRAAVLTALT